MNQVGAMFESKFDSEPDEAHAAPSGLSAFSTSVWAEYQENERGGPTGGNAKSRSAVKHIEQEFRLLLAA